MGCVNGKPDINDVHANVFQVINVDDQGYHYNSAKLEVSDQHLVLHQRGKTAIRWPLRCLRRYGFDAELFSFESGRRCPTGPGIYAFKCRRAEALFNMLQLQIQNITEESASRDILPQQMIGDSAVNQQLAPQSDTSSLQANSIVEGGYLEPIPRGPRPLRHHNSVSGGILGVGVTNISIGGVDGGSVGGGLREGVSPRASIRSPASPPTPLSPTTESFYINSDVIDSVARSDISSQVQPGTGPPSHLVGLSTPPATPTETSQQITYMNTNNSSVSFQNHATPIGIPLGERVVPNIIRNVERSDSVSYTLTERHSLTNSDRPLTYSNMSSAVRTLYNSSYNKLNVDLVDTNYDRLDDLNRYSNHDYMNVVPENNPRDHKLVGDRVYININGHHKDSNMMPAAIPPRTSRTAVAGSGAGSASSSGRDSGTTTTTTTNTDTEQRELNQNPAINYIVLDIRDGSDSSQATPMSPGSTSVASACPESPTGHRGEGYATIDFEKTAALSQAAALRDTCDGSRKTRHNPGSVLVRHNSSLSD